MEKAVKVARQEPVLVVPETPSTRELKELSDIDDQQGLRIQPQVIMAFEATQSKTGQDPAKVIKEALAKALVYYYPFAGRLREGPNKLMVDCNDEGVLFVEADANICLEEIRARILPPCPLLEDFLYDVPGSKGIIGYPLLLFQVTRLICGGFILGARFTHTVSDLQGIEQVLQAMGELARGAQKPSIMPLWERDLLTANYPPTVTCAHFEYKQAGEIDLEQQFFKDGGNVIRGCLQFGAKEIKAIRELFPPDLQKSSSTFELLCAFLWRCRTLALKPDPDELVKFSMYISLRGEKLVSLPTGYYGNALVSPAVATKAKNLLRENSWEYALQLVKESKHKANDEYVRSMLDYMAINQRPDYTEYLHWMTTNHAYIGFEKVDFGWGTPVYAGIPRPPSHLSVQSIFARVENERGEMIRVVLMDLPMQAMIRLRDELRQIFRDQRKSLRIMQANTEIIIARL